MSPSFGARGSECVYELIGANSRNRNDQFQPSNKIRVLGLYCDERQIGFARVVSDGVAVAYLADVYVLEPHRGRGLGLELVREMVENGPLERVRWLLHTRDAHRLYRRLGFDRPGERLMERR